MLKHALGPARGVQDVHSRQAPPGIAFILPCSHYHTFISLSSGQGSAWHHICVIIFMSPYPGQAVPGIISCHMQTGTTGVVLCRGTWSVWHSAGDDAVHA